ncbi:ABC transporter ATP-binding protein [Yinghuangia seranimata]|uniref:ABC transporter ATP-binding protein n=1 Tax=Yinghuangia seranimata TaxID=408067 RepID=UPI00248B5795|nr:ABC transporter ATP-binding protein [Yinghuangia seranimata]MDI2125669.1 ABC transporter ATP-binding protein [Yinghuangia seranimata]
MTPVLEATGISVVHRTRSGPLHAVTDVSLSLEARRTLALVGESGSGKSSIAKAVLHLPPPTSGTVRLDGTDLAALSARELRGLRPRMQMVFQDPLSSLNPRRRVRDIVAEPLDAHPGTPPKGGRDARVDELLDAVGLPGDLFADRRPTQLSGGQAQRVAIARALAAEPRVLIADEAVSALDVSAQATVLNLLRGLTETLGLAGLFISHDLGVVRAVSDDVAVLYLGRLCEEGPTEDVLAAPTHPYTAALLAAVPEPGRALAADTRLVAADPPSPLAPPSGCGFRTRCPLATARCAAEQPATVRIAPDRRVACHHPLTGA